MHHLKKSEIKYGPFPIPGVENVTFAGLTEHPDGGFSALIKMPSGSIIPKHGHQHFEETYMLKGVVECGGTTLSAGDYIRVDSDEQHELKAIEETEFLVIIHQGVTLDDI